jgi:hypothetical protein
MLVPCPSCARHVRTTEERCPFCAAAVPGDVAAVPAPTQRLSRAATYAFATLAAAGVVACEKTAVDKGGQQPGAPATTADAPQAAVYGAPPVQDAPLPAADAGATPAPKAPAR